MCLRLSTIQIFGYFVCDPKYVSFFNKCFFYSLFDVDYIVMLMLYMCNANALVGTVVSPSLIPLTRLSYLNYTHTLRRMHENCTNHEGSKKKIKNRMYVCSLYRSCPRHFDVCSFY